MRNMACELCRTYKYLSLEQHARGKIARVQACQVSEVLTVMAPCSKHLSAPSRFPKIGGCDFLTDRPPNEGVGHASAKYMPPQDGSEISHVVPAWKGPPTHQDWAPRESSGSAQLASSAHNVNHATVHLTLTLTLTHLESEKIGGGSNEAIAVFHVSEQLFEAESSGGGSNEATTISQVSQQISEACGIGGGSSEAKRSFETAQP